MPDLEELFDVLVADAARGTRARGASAAVTRARRRRASLAMGVAAVVAIGGALVGSTLDRSGQSAPIGDTSTPPLPTAPSVVVTPRIEGRPGSPEELDGILARSPGWGPAPTRMDGYDYVPRTQCSTWAWSAISTTIKEMPMSGERHFVGIGEFRFSSRTRASASMAELVDDLGSCTVASWQTRPIAGTGAVLASGTWASAWILQDGATVVVLNAAMLAGPATPDVQTRVLSWLVDHDARQRRD